MVGDQLELAKSLWNEPAFLDWLLSQDLQDKDKSRTRLFFLPDHYASLLYKHEEYDTLIDFFINLMKRFEQEGIECPKISAAMLLGSLAKTSSYTPQQALEKAKQIKGLANIDNMRVQCLLAWLAYR